MIMMRDSNLYIAIAGSVNTLNDKERDFIDSVFDEIFEDTFKKVSYVQEEDVLEMVYELMTPIVDEGSSIKDFYENLEVLLEELSVHDPHFTQFKRGDINA